MGGRELRSQTGSGRVVSTPRPEAPSLSKRAARIALAALAAVAITGASSAAWADDVQAFELAKTRFDAGQYEEAHALFASLLSAANPPCDTDTSRGCRLTDADLIERARTFDAAALLALKKPAEADAQIEKTLRQNPTYRPNPALFPQELVDRFTEQRGRLTEEFERIEKKNQEKRLAEQRAREAQEAWIRQVAKQAGEETVVQVRSRWVAAIPLGVGQYQNGDIGLGVVFTVSEALLGATSIVSAALAGTLKDTYYQALIVKDGRVDTAALLQNIEAAALVNRIAFAGWAAATIAGIVQAQVAFKRESVSTRARPVPPRPVLTPVVTALPGGAGAGFIVRF